MDDDWRALPFAISLFGCYHFKGTTELLPRVAKAEVSSGKVPLA